MILKERCLTCEPPLPNDAPEGLFAPCRFQQAIHSQPAKPPRPSGQITAFPFTRKSREPVQDWVDEYRRGDTEAMARLVTHFENPLFSFILRVTEGRDDAEEIFQEVWFRVIKNMDSYVHDRFISWLFKIAHNLIIDRARLSKRTVDLHRTYPDRDPQEDPLEARVAGRELSPATEVAGRDLGGRIRQAVNRLPPEQKEVFLLRVESHLAFKEVATIQEVSINTVLARMLYALKKLRTELKFEYDDWKGVIRTM